MIVQLFCLVLFGLPTLMVFVLLLGGEDEDEFYEGV
jgi:hypothetical protein